MCQFEKPNLPTWMTLLKLWYHLVEDNAPRPLKMLLAHHPYVVGEKQKPARKKRKKKKLTREEDVHFRLKDKFLPGR